MRIKQLSFPIIIGIFFLSACKRNSINLDFTNAKGEVPQLGNLIFRFSSSMVKDSMLNVWDSTDYISFEPKIAGRFRWENPDQLVFSPAEPLLPATSYKATIKSAVLRFSKYNSVKGGDDISFHTPDLTLDNSQITWIGENSTAAIPRLDLFFNYRINPDDLKERMRIEIDGKNAAFTMVTKSADNKISVNFNDLKPEDKDLSAKLTIDKGLKPESGNNATADPITTSLTVPSPYSLAILNIEPEHDGSDGTVNVITSQQLSIEGLKTFVKFDPEINFSTESTDNGFILRSDKFDVEKSYSLTIAKGLRGKIGGILKEDYNGSVAFGELEAAINFTSSKSVYLSKKGGKNVEVQITNVPKVKLVISKIYENNLLMAQRYDYYPQETKASYASNNDDEYEGDYYSDNSSDATVGDVIYEKEIDTRSLPKSAGGRLLNLSEFEDRLPDFKGIYHVMIRSTKDYWVKDSRYISLSDLGLIAKEGQDKIFVFTNSLKTATPVDGVNISVYAANNQLIGTGATNSEGVAEVSYSKKEFNGFKPAMIIAKTADDFNYLPFNNTKVNTSRFEIGGKRNNPSGLDAFVYAERDIYRPGEKINFSIILRGNEWETPGDIPLKMKFLMPNGKELKSFRKNLNEEGSLEGNIDIATSAITGSYTLEVYTSNDVLLASKNFSVEEFVPDRIKVNTKLDKIFLRPGESANLSINAINFFGPPAANRNYETEIQVKQKVFLPEKFIGYDFSLDNQKTFFDKEVKEGKTDAEGNASINYAVPTIYANTGVLQTNFYTTVFDETGRPVSRAATVDIFTQDVFFGIKREWFYYFPLNQPVKIQLTAVNKDGNTTSSTARVEVIKHEYRTVLTKSGSYFRYESQKEDKLMIENQVTVGNNTPYSYIPRSPGDYEIRIYRPGANAYVSKSFYSYGSWGGNNTSFEVNNEGNIDIALDKKSYLAGENVTALFKTPFSGRMLVTMETDHVVSYQYVDVSSSRNASVDLKLTADHLPNVYITATLIKPHEVSDIPLTVAHGFQNVKVEEKSRKIPVTIVAKKAVRSKTHQKVTVKAEPNSYVTLAAVDNGILQVSDFKTPDPYNYFYQKKALEVTAYDLYPLLFAEVRARLSSTGGDGDLEMNKRVNPMPAKRIKLVSYWSGIKKANGSGDVDFEFDIPQFSGELRLMAVSYKGKNFGGSDNTMTVADPIVISTALPRFLSPGDTVNVPVTLSNTTDKATTVTAGLNVEGPLKIVGGNNQSVTLNAKSEGRSIFKVVASPNIAVGKITVTVNGMGEKFTDATEISVRPPSTLQKVTGSGSIAGGSSQKINIGLSDFIPGSTNYSLVISRSPALELGEQLRYLVQYPYGCTEQTVSAAFPQLYYGDLADLMQLNKQNKVNANTNIIEAIRKIKMRQLYNGAVTLWDNEGTEDWWATIYSAHFLLEAKKAGFDIDNSLLSTMLGYISTKLKNKETIIYYYNRNQNRKIAPKEVAYGLYVLALAGQTNVPAMNYYKANPSILALDSRYLLSAAYATAGDKKSFTVMLPSSFTGEESVAQTGGSYYSDIRDEAIALNALIDVDPGNAQIPIMAKHVSDKLKSRYWLSTQERAFAFLALGKLARGANRSDATAEIKMNGKVVAKADGGQWKGDMAALKGTNIEITTKGNGRLYYYWQAEGINASGAYKEEDSYLKVRRRFYDRFGNAITGNSFKQNDLIIIGITLEKSYSGSVDNVVITDLLPAGFEIENPRTKEIPGMDWIKDVATPTALDVRDDRIHFFIDANNIKQTYYYAVRAVSPGNYKMGPVSADAMYNGEYHSYNGAGIVRVVQ
ncbi:MAG: MG2 domain-containing protein [Bacteroidota bacterium]